MAKWELTIDKLTIDVSALQPEAFEVVCMEEASFTIGNTKKKWLQSKNVNGGNLKPSGYSESYSKAIARGRVTFKAPSVAYTPNLWQRGDLAESFQEERIDGGAEGRFEDGHRGGLSNAELMRVHRERNGFSDPIGFGRDDEQRIKKRFEEEVGKALDKLIRVEKG